jgi:predicted flavoprotein YhiN
LATGAATLHVALRPDIAADELTARLSAPKGKQSLANFLRKAAQLSPVGIGLLQEAAAASGRPLASLRPAELAAMINAVPIRITGVALIARAISSAGGIRFDELDDHLMLLRQPGTFAAGEMLDWEAPTGGYLLQASFATGVAAAKGALRWLDR